MKVKRAPEADVNLSPWYECNLSNIPEDTIVQKQDERLTDQVTISVNAKEENEELGSQHDSSSRHIAMSRHHPYIEHKISMHEGGTISILGVHLKIPHTALSEDHVIAVNVIYDPDMHLPGSACRGRMTHLVRLEPEGLMFKKPVRLTIPHSAIIPEPDRHGVMVFTGQRTGEGALQKGQEDTISLYLYAQDKYTPKNESVCERISYVQCIFVNFIC